MIILTWFTGLGHLDFFSGSLHLFADLALAMDLSVHKIVRDLRFWLNGKGFVNDLLFKQ